MDYEKKYKQLHKFISDLYPFMSEYCKEKVEGFLPEFKESEDEKIRKFLIKWIQDNYYHGTTEIPTKTLIAWLEKQGSEPNWCHHKVDLSNCSEEYRKAYYDGWNNCNQQHSQCKSEWNDVVKCLINGMKFYYEDNEEATWGTEKFSMKVKDILSWLEKQGEQKPNPCDGCINRKGCINCENGELREAEQKPADKVVPKFKVGDWITTTDEEGNVTTEKIIEFWGDKVRLIDTNGFYTLWPKHELNYYHIWTINDANDGDVLSCLNDAGDRDVIFIFKNINSDEGWVFCFCAIDANGCFCTNNDYVGNNNSTNIHPATKEQRDLLFQKMNEAGYEWDADKKELKLLITNGGDFGPTWSEEDEKQLNDIIELLPNLTNRHNWLKSLKDRVQPEQEWNEEDEKMLNSFLHKVEVCNLLTNKENVWIVKKLKSLKPQPHWKPTKQQLTELRCVISGCSFETSILVELEENLKKLL